MVCGLRILVADDSVAVAKVVQSCLERSEYEVTVASDGEAAWEAAQREVFDLIVTDERMPHLSGCQLCRLVRQHPWYRDVPIIFLTAKQLEMRERELEDEFHVAAVFGKPFSPHELARVVRAELSARVPAGSVIAAGSTPVSG